MRKKIKTLKVKKVDSDFEEYRVSEEENFNNIQKSKNIKRKKKYIPWKSLNCWYEILGIIKGILTRKGVEFDILVKNKRTNKEYKAKVNSKKLKYIAPLLLCDYYEKHIID